MAEPARHHPPLAPARAAPAAARTGWQHALAGARVTLPLPALALLGLASVHAELRWPALVGAAAITLLAVGGAWRTSPLLLPLGLLLASGLLALIPSVDLASSLGRLAGLGVAVVLATLVGGWSTTPRRLTTVALLLGGGIFLAAVLLMLRLRGDYPASPLSNLLRPWLRDLALLPPVEYGFAANQVFRLHPNALADLMLALAPLALAGALFGRSPPLRPLLGTLVLLAAGVVLLTSSRAALVILALVSLALLVAWRRRLLLLLPPGLLALVAVFALGLIGKGERTATILSGGADWGRLALWGNLLLLARDEPVLGLGLGTKAVSLRYAAAYLLASPLEMTHAHNSLLQVFIEQGVGGVIGLAWLTAVGLAMGWRAWRAPAHEGPGASAPSTVPAGGAPSGDPRPVPLSLPTGPRPRPYLPPSADPPGGEVAGPAVCRRAVGAGAAAALLAITLHGVVEAAPTANVGLALTAGLAALAVAAGWLAPRPRPAREQRLWTVVDGRLRTLLPAKTRRRRAARWLAPFAMLILAPLPAQVVLVDVGNALVARASVPREERRAVRLPAEPGGTLLAAAAMVSDLALALPGAGAPAQRLAGRVALAAGRFAEAEAALDRALAAEPGDRLSHLDRARVALLRGDDAAAVVELQRARVGAAQLALLARAEFDVWRRPEESLRWYRLAVAVEPGDRAVAGAMASMERYLQRLGR